MSRLSVRGDVPWRDRTVQVVLASTLLAPLGVPLVAPALPVIRDAFALTDAEASLLVSAYFVVGIVVSPFIGLLADRVGRKRVLVPALVVFSTAGLTSYLAPDYATLLALRAIQGTAAAALFVTTVTIIGDVFEGVRRNAVLGVNVAVLSLGAAAFPVLGGVLAAVAWNTPFLAYAFGFPVALFALIALREPPRDDEEPAEDRQSGDPALDRPADELALEGQPGDPALDRPADELAPEGQPGDPNQPDSRPDRGTLVYFRGAWASVTTGMVALLATAFLTEFLLFGALVTALPFLLTASYGLAPVYVGLILMAAEAGAIVVASASGRLARALSNGRIIALGFVAYGVSLVGVYVSPAPVFVAGAVIVFGAGLGLSMPAVDAAISERVTQEYRAGLLGLRNSTTFLGRATGPVVFASAAAIAGYRPLLAVAAGSILAVAVLAVLLTRPSPLPSDPDPSV